MIHLDTSFLISALEARPAQDRKLRRWMTGGSLPDCMIAATALVDGASIATVNVTDFRRFEEFGLELA